MMACFMRKGNSLDGWFHYSSDLKLQEWLCNWWNVLNHSSLPWLYQKAGACCLLTARKQKEMCSYKLSTSQFTNISSIFFLMEDGGASRKGRDWEPTDNKYRTLLQILGPMQSFLLPNYCSFSHLSTSQICPSTVQLFKLYHFVNAKWLGRVYLFS